MKDFNGLLFIMCNIKLYTPSQSMMHVFHFPHRNSAWVNNRLTLSFRVNGNLKRDGV